MKGSLVKTTIKKRNNADLDRLKALPLEQKINLTLRRITDFLNINDNKCYISFSGGKDSTVLLDLVRQVNPDVEAVFIDTGLEFDSIRKFAKSFDNVTTLKPKLRFDEVIKKYGYPVASKGVSQKIYEIRNTKSEKLRETRLNGHSNTCISKRWKFLKDAPFECSHKCCDIMKKNPAKKFEKVKGLSPIIGTMTEESSMRKQTWLKHGCNMFEGSRPKSTPLSFWTEKDIWDYIKTRNLPYADIYDKGAKRTGCVFCMFGYWSKNDHGTENDRMELLKKVEPNKYNYCMKPLEDGGLGLKDVIDFVDNNR